MEKLSSTLINLLKNRGVTSKDEIEEFLSDKPKKTYDPSLLPDMEEGVDLILSEIKSGSKICIYGDYDADGVTSTALMFSVLSHIIDGDRLDFYIPSRFDEGYGLNKEAVKTISDRGFNMIITVDCGSVSAEEVAYAKELGLSVLVTDHHNITDVMADCLLINPKKPGSVYPFSNLSGCGVAFKVAQMIQRKACLPKSVLTEVMDLAAIGTVGDIMPLLDENRTLVKYGIKIINMGTRFGLRKLIEGAGLKVGAVSSENIGFVIVPHLNASGRLEDASQAVKLLLLKEGDPYAQDIVDDLLFKNRERRRLQQETYKKCISLCEEQIIREDSNKFLLINAGDAHEGIAGIVAGKIKDTYYRPTVLVTPSGEDQEFFKGTGRSIEGVDLYGLLKLHESCFEKFGGHAGACGFLMKAERLEKLRTDLNEDMKNLLSAHPDLFIKKHCFDLTLSPKNLTMDFAEQISLLEPFGNKNPEPLIKLKDVIPSDIKKMGTEGQHLSFTVADCEGNRIKCVLFNKAALYEGVVVNCESISVIGSLTCNVWQGQKRLQFIVREIL